MTPARVMSPIQGVLMIQAAGAEGASRGREREYREEKSGERGQGWAAHRTGQRPVCDNIIMSAQQSQRGDQGPCQTVQYQCIIRDFIHSCTQFWSGEMNKATYSMTDPALLPCLIFLVSSCSLLMPGVTQSQVPSSLSSPLESTIWSWPASLVFAPIFVGINISLLLVFTLGRVRASRPALAD